MEDLTLVHAGKCLRMAQANAQITNVKLAADIGHIPQDIVKWRARKDMKLSRAVMLAEYFGLTMDEFVAFGREK